MTESDLSPENATALALRKALEKAELAYRDAMPLDKPAALIAFEEALAVFADFLRRRENSGEDTPIPRDQPQR